MFGIIARTEKARLFTTHHSQFAVKFYISLQPGPEKLSTKPIERASNIRKRKLDHQYFKRYKMSLRSKFSSALTLAFAVVGFGVVVSAQETPKTQDDNLQK